MSRPKTATKRRKGLIDVTGSSVEAFRALRLALQLRTDSTSGNIVLFTSAEPGEGKSTVAANFALVSSLSNRSVLLVDADLRRPTQHEIFGIDRTPGVVDVLATGADLASHVHAAPTLGALDVLPAGAPVSHAGDLASSKRMHDLLGHASSRYGLVVFDSPPILGAADAEGIASHPGVEVVVVTTRATKRRTLLNALKRLELTEANVGGIVVNREGRAGSYGY